MKYLHNDPYEDILKMKIITLYRYKTYLEKTLAEVKTELQDHIARLEAQIKEMID